MPKKYTARPGGANEKIQKGVASAAKSIWSGMKKAMGSESAAAGFTKSIKKAKKKKGY